LENDKIQSAVDEIANINMRVNEMTVLSANKKDIRTFQFVADQFGTTLDTVAKWFIITIIFVFDPLAIALILAYNVATYKKEDTTGVSTLSPILQRSVPTPVVHSQQPTEDTVVPTQGVEDTSTYPKEPLGNPTPPRPNWL
jgi:hypothetical protein